MIESKFRIAHVATGISLNQILRNQLRLLKEEGFDVEAIADEDHWSCEVMRDGVPLRSIGMSRRPHLFAMFCWGVRLYRSLRTNPVEIIHTHNAVQAFIGRIAARWAGVPIIVHTVHGWPFHDAQSRVKYYFYVLLERLAGLATDAVFFQNHDDARLAQQLRILPIHKIYYVGNGIDIELFESELAKVDRATARRSLGLGLNDVVFTMVARLEAPKGHRFFLLAFRQLLGHLPQAKALFVGTGFIEQQIRHLVQINGLEQSVRFLGYRKDIPTLLRAGDVFVLTSVKEGLPRSIIEAMLAGVPVVATDVPGNRDAIKNEETGLLVQYGETEELASALRRLATDPKLYERLRIAAQMRARRCYDERKVTHEIAEIYRKLFAARQDVGR